MTRSNNKISYTILGIFFAFQIVTTRFFYYKNWDFKNYIYIPFYLYFIYVIFSKRVLLGRTRKEMHFVGLIKYLIIIPFLCIISYLANGETGWSTHPTVIIALCSSITFLCYYALHALKVNERTLITLFLSLAICIFVIQIIQQLNPGNAVFGVKSNFEDVAETMTREDFIEQRNGLYRYRIEGVLMSIVAFCFTWQRFLRKKNLMNFISFAIFATSIYLFLTRQRMIAGIGTCIFSVFLMGKTKISSKLKYLIPIIVLFFVLYFLRDALFGSLFEQTQDQTDKLETDVRTLAFAYYWNEIISNPLTFLFGAGSMSAAADGGTMYNMNWNDIGIIGQWFVWGIGIVISYFYILYQMLVKKANEIPPYVKFFVFMTFLTSILIFPYREPSEFFVWAVLLYICDLHINKSPLALYM